MQMMNHTDTNLWYIQVVTGFLMFFLGSVHLYIMLTNPGSIDPYMSADRIVSGNLWPLYLILLVCVELHGTIGLYRLCMKWGWFAGKDAKKSRQNLKKMKNRATIFFMTVGILALLVFIVIGIGHRDRVGERYGSHVSAVEKVQADEPAHVEEQVQVDDQTQAEEPAHVEEQVQAEQSHEDEEFSLQKEGHETQEAQPADATHQ